MFGYVLAREDTLPPGAREDYEAIYCTLCHAMGSRYGLFSRLFLNYDFAFLAMLLAPGSTTGAEGCHRCILHPLSGKPSCCGGPWLEVAGAESVILTYWKLQDNAADGGLFKGTGSRFLSHCLGGAYRKAREVCPGFDRQTEELLAELSGLEQEGCPSMDRTADCFARILRGAAPPSGDPARDRVLGELLYHVGRWIYLADAVDDLEEDRAAGRYNPVAARFPGWNEEDKAYLRKTMDHSLALAGAAFQLLEDNPWSAVVENILYSGLPGVEELIFTGHWRDRQKRQRRDHT